MSADRENLLLNCFPIRPIVETASVFVSPVPMDGFRKISKARITKNNNDRAEIAYWSVTDLGGAAPHEIHVSDNLFRDLLNEELWNHFATSGFPHRRSFLGGTEVWVPAAGSSPPPAQEYRAFRLRILSPKNQHAASGWNLLVSYSGRRLTYPKNAEGIEVPDGVIKNFVHGEEIIRTKTLEGPIPDTAQAVLNRDSSKLLGIDLRRIPHENKYKTFYAEVMDFYSMHLKGRQIGTTFAILESGLANIMESQVWRTPVESNILEFANGKTHFNAYIGLKEHGPISGPRTPHYRFFFIFHTDSRDHANRFYQYLNRGFKGYPGLKAFVDVDLHLDRSKTITFQSADRPSEEIDAALRQMMFEEGVTYFAFYLSPIDREDPDDERHSQYFRIKEALLMRNIGSQVVFRENIEKPNFNFFLPNISIALLAKLGGIPWRLKRDIQSELIIGIGAYRQEDMHFLGTTFTFRNDGTFVGFDAANCSDVNQLGTFFEGAIRSFISDVSSIKRVVIHFYKSMNAKEVRQLEDTLTRLELQVPYIVLTIANERDAEYVVFDEAFAGLMPRSGICVKLRHDEFLLCNNTRYQSRTAARIDDYPFPLKVAISRTNLGSGLDAAATRELLDQIYQFSRVYWRSVKQRTMPVTILYSEKIADMAAHFPDRTVPDTEVSKQTLWFL